MLNSAPSVFNFNSNQVRTINRDGIVWFVAADVCKALGYLNVSKAVGDHLDDDERSYERLGRTPNELLGVADKHNESLDLAGRPSLIINESGLYALVLRSRKPEARKFAKWVTSEVLPTIRATGEYRVQYCVNPNDTLTAAQAEELRLVLKETCEKLPKAQQAQFMVKGWAKLKSHFGVKYRQIPQREFTEAVSLLTRHAAEWELVADTQPELKFSAPGDIGVKAYHQECRAELWKFMDALPKEMTWPTDPEVAQRIADGFLTDILASKYWIVRFNQGSLQIVQSERQHLINPSSDEDLSDLITHQVPIEKIPKIMEFANRKLSKFVNKQLCMPTPP